jgi:hypothetical protein
LNGGPGICGIDFWPKSLTIGIDAGLVGVHSLSAFLLTVSHSSTETARFVVPVGVVAWIVRPPLLVVAVVVVLLLWPRSLTLLLLISVPLALWNELFGTRLCHSFHNVFFFLGLLHWIDSGSRFRFLLGS